MGSHFFGLLKCDKVSTIDDARLVRLETMGHVDSRHLIDMLQPGSGYCTVASAWISAMDYSEMIDRPHLITSAQCFRTKEGLHLTFSSDSVGIWHSLRWSQFIRDPDWQSAMLDGCRRLCALFAAEDAIVTHDGSPIRRTHLQGDCFDEAVGIGLREEGKVATISELYTVIDEKALTWDSRGFWQFPRGREGK
jgi:hypothetical protein